MDAASSSRRWRDAAGSAGVVNEDEANTLRARGVDKAAVLGRERFADSGRWFWMSSSIGAVVVAIFFAAAIPTYGWLPFLLVGVPGVAGAVASLLGYESAEHKYAIGHGSYLFALGLCAVQTGGAHSFLLPVICPFALGFFSRLRPAVAISYACGSFAAASIPVLVFDWSGFLDAPWLLLSSAVSVCSLVLVAAPMAAREIHHRGEATIDQLTGLLNRRGLEDRLAELAQQALVIGEDTPMALIACDLDHFKLVNDNHGHARGDAVLQDVAYIIRKGLRRFELAYRMGGEEFLILLPGHESSEALRVAERIRAAIEVGRPGGIDVTISMGVAHGRAADFAKDKLLEMADAAVYEAKRTGRNRVVVATAPGPPLIDTDVGPAALLR